VTVFFGIVDRRDGRLVYSSAGHTTAAILGAAGKVSQLHSTGPLLGAFNEITFDQAEPRIDGGKVLFLYTDGLTESRRDREMLEI
jgi:serine phosphatase RsbU (regulator of sigma subunit)